jgi:hypothetical protein
MESRHILHAIKKGKTNWIGHNLCKNCQVIERKIEWKERNNGEMRKKT